MKSANSKGRFISGVSIICVGLILLFFRSGHISSFHLVIGGLLLAGYFYKGSYGLLIPACLLISLSLTAVKSRYLGFSDVNLFWLGSGFIAIYIIDRLYKGRTHWWPLIPGIILILAGINKLSDLFDIGWPLILIILGVWIILNALGLFKKND